MSYLHKWTPLVIVGTVFILSLPWLGLIALMVVLAVVAPPARAIVSVPCTLGRAISRRLHGRGGASPRAAAALRGKRFLIRISGRRGRPGKHSSRTHPVVVQYDNLGSRTHPAGGGRKRPEAPPDARPSPQAPERKELLWRRIPAYHRSTRKCHDRPVTPEVAGSSPVAPVKVPANRHIVLPCLTPGRRRLHTRFSKRRRNSGKRRGRRVVGTILSRLWAEFG
jgi:hypothetical protein